MMFVFLLQRTHLMSVQTALLKCYKFQDVLKRKKSKISSKINILVEINSAQKELLHILGPVHSFTAVTWLPRWHNYLSKILWKTLICHLD